MTVWALVLVFFQSSQVLYFKSEKQCDSVHKIIVGRPNIGTIGCVEVIK